MHASSGVTVSSGKRSGRLPDFFIVGHPKSGTTALYEMLRRHPQIYMPYVKEPWYFVPELRADPRRTNTARHPDTLEKYLALFADARPEQLVGEATPSYLWSHQAAQRIAEAQPDARIIAILREPASFLRSLHMQFIQTHIETEGDLRTAIELEDRRTRGESLPANSTRPAALRYSEHVRYVEQLRRYHAVFPNDRVLVLIYEEFRADNAAAVREVLRFLGADPDTPIEVVDANPSVRIRSPKTYSLVRSLSLGRTGVTRRLKAPIKALTSRRFRHDLLATLNRAQRREPAPPDPELVRDLQRRFKGEVVALSEYLNRDLVQLWGYDTVP